MGPHYGNVAIVETYNVEFVLINDDELHDNDTDVYKADPVPAVKVRLPVVTSGVPSAVKF